MKKIQLFILLSFVSSIYGQDKCFYLPQTIDANCSPIYCILVDSDSCEVFLEEFILFDYYGEIYSINYDTISPYYSSLYTIGHEVTANSIVTGNYRYSMRVYFKEEDCWGEFKGEIKVYNSQR